MLPSSRFFLSVMRPSRAGSLLAAAITASLLAAQEAVVPPPPASAAAPSSEAGTGAVESQRERNRVLQKRNPIASEYQTAGELGLAPGAIADGESVDFRSLLPALGSLLGGADANQLSASYLYHSASERGKPGFTASVVSSVGPDARLTKVQVQAALTAANRVVDTALWTWSPTSFTHQGESVYFLDRPRMQSDQIDTRTRSARLQIEHRLGADHTIYAQIEGWDYTDFFRRDMLEYRFGGGQALPGRGDAPQGGPTIVDGAYLDARFRRVATEEAVDRERIRVLIRGES